MALRGRFSNISRPAGRSFRFFAHAQPKLGAGASGLMTGSESPEFTDAATGGRSSVSAAEREGGAPSPPACINGRDGALPSRRWNGRAELRLRRNGRAELRLRRRASMEETELFPPAAGTGGRSSVSAATGGRSSVSAGVHQRKRRSSSLPPLEREGGAPSPPQRRAELRLRRPTSMEETELFPPDAERQAVDDTETCT